MSQCSSDLRRNFNRARFRNRAIEITAAPPNISRDRQSVKTPSRPKQNGIRNFSKRVECIREGSLRHYPNIASHDRRRV